MTGRPRTVTLLDNISILCVCRGGWQRPVFSESTLSFTAPETGAYAFDTAGSVHDTVVYVLNGGCKGEELACNDDFGNDNRQSRAIVSLTAGPDRGRRRGWVRWGRGGFRARHRARR